MSRDRGALDKLILRKPSPEAPIRPEDAPQEPQSAPKKTGRPKSARTERGDRIYSISYRVNLETREALRRVADMKTAENPRKNVVSIQDVIDDAVKKYCRKYNIIIHD